MPRWCNRRISRPIATPRPIGRGVLACDAIGVMSQQPSAASDASGFIDLYWIPVGAGTRFQKFSLSLYEGLLARISRRPTATLLHAALKLGIDGRRFTLEVTPSPAGPNSFHEVTGPVGIRGADRLRLFRYQVCLREGNTLPDEGWAVVPAVRLGTDDRLAADIAALTKSVPAYTWGRRRKGHPEMWTSDSCVSWLLSRAGLAAEALEVPAGCRAPGWSSGIVEARKVRASDRRNEASD